MRRLFATAVRRVYKNFFVKRNFKEEIRTKQKEAHAKKLDKERKSKREQEIAFQEAIKESEKHLEALLKRLK